MALLHLIRTSPFHTHDFFECIDSVNKNDTVILMDDGCYASLHHDYELAKQAVKHIYMLDTHALARGLDIAKITTITEAQLIAQIAKNEGSITWQ